MRNIFLPIHDDPVLCDTGKTKCDWLFEARNSYCPFWPNEPLALDFNGLAHRHALCLEHERIYREEAGELAHLRAHAKKLEMRAMKAASFVRLLPPLAADRIDKILSGKEDE